MKTHTLAVIATLLGALGGAAAFMTYLESKSERGLRVQVLGLDKQLKELELSKATNKTLLM